MWLWLWKLFKGSYELDVTILNEGREEKRKTDVQKSKSHFLEEWGRMPAAEWTSRLQISVRCDVQSRQGIRRGPRAPESIRKLKQCALVTFHYREDTIVTFCLSQSIPAGDFLYGLVLPFCRGECTQQQDDRVLLSDQRIRKCTMRGHWTAKDPRKFSQSYKQDMDSKCWRLERC